MKGHKVFVQGYNAQAVVTANEIVLAAEVSTEPVDFSALKPLMHATEREFEQARVATRPQVAIADTGFWNEQQMDRLAADGVTVLIPPESGRRKTPQRSLRSLADRLDSARPCLVPGGPGGDPASSPASGGGPRRPAERIA